MKQSIILGIMIALTACHINNNQPMITSSTAQNTIAAITTTYPEADSTLVARGVKQVAALWHESDGSENDFQQLLTSSYAGTSEQRHAL